MNSCARLDIRHKSIITMQWASLAWMPENPLRVAANGLVDKLKLPTTTIVFSPNKDGLRILQRFANAHLESDAASLKGMANKKDCLARNSKVADTVSVFLCRSSVCPDEIRWVLGSPCLNPDLDLQRELLLQEIHYLERNPDL